MSAVMFCAGLVLGAAFTAAIFAVSARPQALPQPTCEPCGEWDSSAVPGQWRNVLSYDGTERGQSRI